MQRCRPTPRLVHTATRGFQSPPTNNNRKEGRVRGQPESMFLLSFLHWENKYKEVKDQHLHFDVLEPINYNHNLHY